MPHVLTDTAGDTDHHHIVTRLEIRPLGRLVRCGGSVCHYSQVFQGDISPIFDFTQINARYRNVARKTAVKRQAVARHFLVETPVAAAGFA